MIIYLRNKAETSIFQNKDLGLIEKDFFGVLFKNTLFVI